MFNKVLCSFLCGCLVFMGLSASGGNIQIKTDHNANPYKALKKSDAKAEKTVNSDEYPYNYVVHNSGDPAPDELNYFIKGTDAAVSVKTFIKNNNDMKFIKDDNTTNYSSEAVPGSCISADAKWLVTALSKHIAIYKNVNQKLVQTDLVENTCQHAASISANGRWIADITTDSIYLYSNSSGILSETCHIKNTCQQAVSISADDEWIADATKDSIYLYENKNGSLVEKDHIKNTCQQAVSISADGEWIADATKDSIYLYENKNGSLVEKDHIKNTCQKDVSISADGGRIVDATTDSIYLYVNKCGSLVATNYIKNIAQTGIRFSYDGNWVIDSTSQHLYLYKVLKDYNLLALYTTSDILANLVINPGISGDGKYFTYSDPEYAAFIGHIEDTNIQIFPFKLIS